MLKIFHLFPNFLEMNEFQSPYHILQGWSLFSLTLCPLTSSLVL